MEPAQTCGPDVAESRCSAVFWRCLGACGAALCAVNAKSVHVRARAQACIHSVEEALACCKRIGYPIMLKASWGGGGKGIRKARAAPAYAARPVGRIVSLPFWLACLLFKAAGLRC